MNRSLSLCIAVLPLASAVAQINTGSNGSDGAFNPTQPLFVDMSDHPDGIYQYTSVNIPDGVGVSFHSNANNTPVVWLVQGDCTIAGYIYIQGQGSGSSVGSPGGPGGYSGGSGGPNPLAGEGPGAGLAGTYGANASYGSLGGVYSGINLPGAIYGNSFLLPLLGGSGGGGGVNYAGGGGGGGAILIAASGQISVLGQIVADGGPGFVSLGGNPNAIGGNGSGGGIRLIATKITGTGLVSAAGGSSYGTTTGGLGRIRFDSYKNAFGGTTNGVFTQGFQPIIIPAPGQGVQLNIQSVAGNTVVANPSGVLTNPDVIVPAQTTNPVPIVVSCTNVPLNSEITVTVNPANGSAVQAVGLNNVGSATASTATISLNLPTGGGIIYASAVTGINGGTASNTSGKNAASYAKTGLAANGERFTKIETKAFLGGKQQTTLITKSGKRYQVPN